MNVCGQLRKELLSEKAEKVAVNILPAADHAIFMPLLSSAHSCTKRSEGAFCARPFRPSSGLARASAQIWTFEPPSRSPAGCTGSP